MKTIGFKPENFNLLLQGPTVKSTTIRAGDKMKRFVVGEHIEARCNKTHQAVECELTGVRVVGYGYLTDADARADGFPDVGHLQRELLDLNPRVKMWSRSSPLTIIGLGLVGEVRDTRFEPFGDSALEALQDITEKLRWLDPDCRAFHEGAMAELKRRKPEVQG